MIKVFHHIDEEDNFYAVEECRIDLVDGELIYYAATMEKLEFISKYIDRYFVNRKRWTPEDFMTKFVPIYQGRMYSSNYMDVAEPLEFSKPSNQTWHLPKNID